MSRAPHESSPDRSGYRDWPIQTSGWRAHFVASEEGGRVSGSSLPNIEGLPMALRSLPSVCY